jgi:hypothetical protein
VKDAIFKKGGQKKLFSSGFKGCKAVLACPGKRIREGEALGSGAEVEQFFFCAWSEFWYQR